MFSTAVEKPQFKIISFKNYKLYTISIYFILDQTELIRVPR